VNSLHAIRNDGFCPPRRVISRRTAGSNRADPRRRVADETATVTVTDEAHRGRPGAGSECLVQKDTFESWSVTTTICLLSARSIPTTTLLTGTIVRSRVSRVLRLRSRRGVLRPGPCRRR
jgi:hypothetical protein